MTNLVTSLFRIDPTEGLVQYVNAIKPYHSKVLDVLIEYIYTEKITAKVNDRWHWDITLARPKSDIEYSCGYGLAWDPVRTPESNPSANIISAQSSIKLAAVVRSFADTTLVTISQVGFSLVSGTKVTVSTTGTLPASVPQVQVGTVYDTVGHNGGFALIDPLSGTHIDFLSSGAGVMSIEPAELKFNSFLVEENLGNPYTIAATNIKSNQFTFVTSYAITQVVPATKSIVVAGDIRPTHPVLNVTFDDVSIATPRVAGNCMLVISGNNEDHFPPGSTITLSSSSAADGTYTVAEAASGRPLTRYDGNHTIIPVNELIPHSVALGVLIPNVTSLIPTGALVHVAANTEIGCNGRYTVASVSVSGSLTTIVVNESVSVLSNNDGLLHVPVSVTRIPAWPAGLLLSFNSTGTLPAAVGSAHLYYAPTSTPGVFNLATKRYPSVYDDYVNIADVGTGILTASRAEQFHPGASITVSGSYLRKNDGQYTVKKTSTDVSGVRVWVMEKVPRTTPPDRQFDGIAEFNYASFDSPTYCPVSKSSDMHTNTFIHETIMFEYGLMLSETIATAVQERTPSGYGVSSFGTEITPFGTSSDNTMDGTSITSVAGTILVHGIDVQLFDVGGFVETLDSVSKNYGRVI